MTAIRSISIRPLLSTAAVLAVYGLIFHLLDRFDWDQPFVRFICLSSLLWACLVVRRPAAPGGDVGRSAVPFELVLAAGLALVLAERALFLGWGELALPPRVDVGVTTRDAVRMFFIDGLNPYQSETIAVLGEDPRYWGYKYGPGMILGYSICWLSADSGIKLANLTYLALALLAVFKLARREDDSPGGLATAWFCCVLTLVPNRIWYELFHQGVIDIFPIALILLSLLCVGRRAWFLAGLLAGLSFSAKFSPGVFYLILFLRREKAPRFYAGVAAGLLPLLAFLAWDPGSLFRNFLAFHLIKGYDSTSLYSITPRELHFIFPAVQAAAAACILAANYGDRLTPRSLGRGLLLLLLVVEATYKEVHENHLIWFIPLAALHLGVNRHAFLPGISRMAGLPGRAPAASVTFTGERSL